MGIVLGMGVGQNVPKLPPEANSGTLERSGSSERVAVGAGLIDADVQSNDSGWVAEQAGASTRSANTKILK